MGELLLGLDIGTTSLGAGVFSPDGKLRAWSSRRLTTRSPTPGRLEQDAAAIWRAALAVMRSALAQAGRTASDLAAIGITSQRTSAVIWDRRSGRPLTPLVLWSDLRGAERATGLRGQGFFVTPQQAAAKLEAMFAGVDHCGDLAWGNIDSYLIWRLSGGSAHVTDRSQAWPTGYLDLATMGWNQRLIALQGLDAVAFPRLVDTWGPIAETAPSALAVSRAHRRRHRRPAGGADGPRRRAGRGEGHLRHLRHPRSGHRRRAGAERPFYAALRRLQCRWRRRAFCIEGMVYTAGAALDWTRNTMRMGTPAVFDALAASAPDTGGAWFLPALQGLGAPHGDASRLGAIGGLSLGASRAQIARAALEGVAFPAPARCSNMSTPWPVAIRRRRWASTAQAWPAATSSCRSKQTCSAIRCAVTRCARRPPVARRSAPPAAQACSARTRPGTSSPTSARSRPDDQLRRGSEQPLRDLEASRVRMTCLETL